MKDYFKYKTNENGDFEANFNLMQYVNDQIINISLQAEELILSDLPLSTLETLKQRIDDEIKKRNNDQEIEDEYNRKLFNAYNC